MKLSDQVAIVTGAGRGIGAAIARAFAREGAAVIVNYSRSTQQAETLIDQIEAAGGRASAVQADVGDLTDHGRLVSAALEYYGSIEILVNNAGIETRQPFLDATPEVWDRTFDVNLKGAYFLAQRAARVMRDQGKGGKILNISSVHDERAHRNNSIYTMTKGGMKLMTRGLALELATHNIQVNSLSPGAIETDINREVLTDKEFRTKVLGMIPAARIGSVEDLTAAAVLLCSQDANYITGATLYVDGGLLL